jgi:hypothetical protein
MLIATNPLSAYREEPFSLTPVFSARRGRRFASNGPGLPRGDFFQHAADHFPLLGERVRVRASLFTNAMNITASPRTN